MRKPSYSVGALLDEFTSKGGTNIRFHDAVNKTSMGDMRLTSHFVVFAGDSEHLVAIQKYEIDDETDYAFPVWLGTLKSKLVSAKDPDELNVAIKLAERGLEVGCDVMIETGDSPAFKALICGFDGSNARYFKYKKDKTPSKVSSILYGNYRWHFLDDN